ncbi:MAG: hypothetical protein AAGA77_14020 [Bacteroidota bacterium]
MADRTNRGKLSTDSGPIIMSNPPHPNTQLASRILKASNLSELRDLYKKHGISVNSNYSVNVSDLPTSESDVEGKGLDDLVQASHAYVNGQIDLPKGVQNLIDKFHAPYQIRSFDVEDIVVTPSNPWRITGDQPVVVNVNKVTVEPGGQIFVETDAAITIQELIKT